MSEEQEQFNQAFGEHTGICRAVRNFINGIRNNHPDVNDLKIRSSDVDRFTDLSWRLLGRYIANNTHLEKVDLINCGLADEKMASLFYELTYSTSMKELLLCHNSFGIEGLRSMVPFLNDTNLSDLNFYRNNNFDSDCFELLVQTLHGRPSEGRTLECQLSVSNCNITNISTLETHNLLYLQKLTLNNNEIGREGCIPISNLLQQEGSTLKHLDLDRTGIDDHGAEILATSLKRNTKLQILGLNRNNITERGYKVFLKLLNDASSIENTYNSNHTLRDLDLYSSGQGVNASIREHVQSAIRINNLSSTVYINSAGRAKIIKYQLNRKNRKVLCRLQGIDYSAGSNFADIEPILLPRILALIGEEHGQREFYRALIPMVSDLMSCVDISGMMKALVLKNEAYDNELAKQMAELTRQRAALTAKNDQLSRRLAERESGGSRRSTIEEGNGKTATTESGKKRLRSEDKD